MRDDNEPVKVHISKGDVHKAVRNILKNELDFDPAGVRAELVAAARSQLDGKIFDTLGEYGPERIQADIERVVRAELASWKGAIQSRIEREVILEAKSVIHGMLEAMVLEAARGQFALTVGRHTVAASLKVNQAGEPADVDAKPPA